MRRQDLKKFDLNMMIGILSVFCLLFVLFFSAYIYGLITSDMILNSIKTYLWMAYAIILVITTVVYFISGPSIKWSRPIAETDEIKTGQLKLVKGETYIVDMGKGFQVFKETLSYGLTGMAITRNNPEEVRQQHGLTKTSVIWLTESRAENSLDPSDVENINYTLDKFMSSTKNGVILFEGLEYLVTFLNFHKVIHLFQDLKDKVSLAGHTLIIPLNKSVIPKAKLGVLEREMVTYS
jgi:hypothetical protein